MAIMPIHYRARREDETCARCGTALEPAPTSYVATLDRGATCRRDWTRERAELQGMLNTALKAAHGDSNDEEIEAWREAAEAATDTLDRALARIAELERGAK